MKKILLKILIMTFLLTLVLFPGVSSADESSNDTITALEAKKAAVFQIVMDMKANKESPWRNKTVKIQEPIEVYDATDSLYSYLFNLTVDGKPAGFIEVSALKDEYPILSFAREGSVMDPSQIAKLKQKNKDKNPVLEKVVVLGPAYFGLKQDFADGSAEILSPVKTISLTKDKNKPNPKQKLGKNNDARKLRKDINLVVGDIGTPNDGVTDDLSFETGLESFTLIGGVPDMNQIYSSLWTGPSGCSPTSAANIMKYWSSHGFPKLTQGLSDEQLLLQLRNAMGTRSDGSTPVNNIAPGMQTFARNRGVTTAWAGWLSPTWEAYKSGINNNGPNVISFVSQTYYGDHSVTGVGWTEFFYNGSSQGHQYMEVHDNWPTTPMSVFVAFGRNYAGIFFDQFDPQP